MNILLLINRLDYGGAENYVTDLANSLLQRGHQVVVAARPGRRLNLLKPGISFIPLNLNRFHLLFAIIKIKKVIKEYQVEIIHAHQRRPIFLGAIVHNLTGIPLVATLHGKLKKDLPLKYVRRSITRLITVCRFWMEQVKESDPELFLKTTVIPNGINQVDFSTSRRKSELGKITLLYASRLGRVHGKVVGMLIEQVMPTLSRRYEDIQLIISGDGEHYRELAGLAMRVNDRCRKEIIKFVGYQENIASYIQKADIVLGVGRVAMEALCGGTPLIAINKRHLGGPVSRENIDYLLENNFLARNQPFPNPDALSRLIDQMLDNYEFWLEESRRLRQIIVANYELNRMTANICQLYEEIGKLS